jgi:hypothetical protein
MSNYSLRNRTTAPESVPSVSQEATDAENTNDNKSTNLALPPASPKTTQPPTSLADTQCNSSSSSDEASLQELMFWDGTIPKANGKVAKLFTDTNTRANKKTHEDLVVFLYSKDTKTKGNKLQFDTSLISFLTAVPGSKRAIRLVYGIGTGIGLTGIKSNNLENQILALSGEYEEGIAYPTVLQYPASALTPTKQKTPSFPQFQEQLSAGNKNSTWFKYGDLNDIATLPMLVPVPARFIVDGFENDLDAAVVFEQLTDISDNEEIELKATLHLL